MTLVRQHKYKIIGKINGGSNCMVFKLKNCSLKRDVVVKLLNLNVCDNDVEKILTNDFNYIRKELIKNNILIPDLINLGFNNKDEIDEKYNYEINSCAGEFMVIEEVFVGISLREIIRSKNGSEEVINRYIDKAIRFVEKLPNTIPLDTNTGNIVFREPYDSAYFVDIIPPDPWKHESDKKLQKQLGLVFPSLKDQNLDKEKMKRYYLTEYRVKKLHYYIEKDKKSTAL